MYYVQYAHARIAGILRNAEAANAGVDAPKELDLHSSPLGGADHAYRVICDTPARSGTRGGGSTWRQGAGRGRTGGGAGRRGGPR